MRAGLIAVAVLATVFALPGGAAAQEEPLAVLAIPLPFNFLNPGARSLALGSAFTGLADDATAAFTNPAGLTQLTVPEISFEGRFNRSSRLVLAGGRFGGGPVTNLGIDTFSGPDYDPLRESRFSPSFLSVVIPGTNWSAAGYFQEVIHSRQSITSQGGIFHVPGAPPQTGNSAGMRPGDIRQFGYRASREVTLATFGASAAFKPVASVSLGAGLTITKADIAAASDALESVGYAFVGRVIAQRLRQSGSATRVGFVSGAQWTPRPEFRLGGAFRKAPSIEYEQAGGFRDETTCDRGERFNRCFFKIPDQLSVGVAVAPSQNLTVTVDYNRVRYSQLFDDYLRRLGEFDLIDIAIDDANELHAGVEYIVSRWRIAPAVRVGAWYEPDHAVRLDELEAVAFLGALFPETSGRVHGTAGTGISLGAHLELNIAADIAKDSTTASASAIVRF